MTTAAFAHSKGFQKNRVGGHPFVEWPPSHATVRTGRYTAVQAHECKDSYFLASVSSQNMFGLFPAVFPPRIPLPLHRLLRTSSRSVAVASFRKLRLIHRCEPLRYRLLEDAVDYRWDSQRSRSAVRFRYLFAASHCSKCFLSSSYPPPSSVYSGLTIVQPFPASAGTMTSADFSQFVVTTSAFLCL